MCICCEFGWWFSCGLTVCVDVFVVGLVIGLLWAMTCYSVITVVVCVGFGLFVCFWLRLGVVGLDWWVWGVLGWVSGCCCGGFWFGVLLLCFLLLFGFEVIGLGLVCFGLVGLVWVCYVWIFDFGLGWFWGFDRGFWWLSCDFCCWVGLV